MRKLPLIFLILASIIALSVGSCTSDYLTPECSTNDMSYSKNVVPILKNNCYQCHSKGNSAVSNGLLLDNYDSLKPFTVDVPALQISRLVGVISHHAGLPAMPYMKPQLDACSINQITYWVFQGAKNN